MGALAATAVVRHPEMFAILSRDACTLVRPGVRIMTYRGRAAQTVERLLEAVAAPLARERIPATVPEATPAALDRLVGTLLERGLLIDADAPPQPLAVLPSARLGRVVAGACGAVQAARFSGYLDRLVYAPDTEVQVALSRAAQGFIQPESLTHLYGIQPWLSLEERRPGITSPHIALATWADVVLILPATAHFFHRLATGAASDLLGLIAIATRAPVVLAPSMNEAMWRHPAVRRNVRQTIEDGAYVVLPAAGYEVATSLDGDGRTSSELKLGSVGVGSIQLPRLLRVVQSLADRSKAMTGASARDAEAEIGIETEADIETL